MGRVSFTVASLLVVSLLAGGASVAAQPDEQDKPGAARASAAPAAPVNLNTATQAQLETLPGIGAATAKRILEYRQKSGSFKKIEDILDFSRLGPYLLNVLSFSPTELVS
jgi:competence ComEA-like helix-hairpin-helix protein